MTLLAETIVQTVQTVLAGVVATIYRGRVDQIQDANLPAVGLYQGAEQNDGRVNMGVMDEFLEIRTDVAAKGLTGNIETTLNDLRRQVHLILMAENALNLPYVVDIIPNGVDEPDIDGESDQLTGTMVCNWIVHYRHQPADAGLAP